MQRGRRLVRLEPEMTDRDAALARRASLPPWWRRTLSFRRDLAAARAARRGVGRRRDRWQGGGLFTPLYPFEAVHWVLLVIGPVALVARRRQAAEPGRGRLTRKRSLGGALLPGRRLRTPAVADAGLAPGRARRCRRSLRSLS